MVKDVEKKAKTEKTIKKKEQHRDDDEKEDARVKNLSTGRRRQTEEKERKM